MALASRRLAFLAAAAAIALLNASLSFHNVWPTPAIRWTGEVSIEAAVCLLVLVVALPRFGPAPRALLRALAVLWVFLVIGHYADVTTPALYGRDINLYWDLRYMPDVAAMAARAAPLWLVVAVVAAVALILVVLYRMFRWAFGRIVDAMTDARARLALGSLASIVVVLFAAQRVRGTAPDESAFSRPVTETYARQARLVAGAMRRSATIAPGPAMDADLALARGADVFLIFIESYGAIAYERADVAPHLQSSRGELAAAIDAIGRRVVSAYVDSPTFGGSSWLAHVSLMSGVEVRDPETNARLMTEKRGTMVTTFARRGYRTIALMPGLRQRWPEGAFYGFDDIYGAARLEYHGPEFGWFAIPDQFSLARLKTLEVDAPSRPPLFVFFPTISTHFPFSPTPPYQPDWSRIFMDHPYDGPAIVRAYAQQPNWTDFAPGYAQAVSYTYETLAGYLRASADRDFVMIVLGDHQPAAAVSGEGAPWSVPVHVITSRAPILDRLRARGFRNGLTPARPPLGPMHTLLPILLDAFSAHPPP